MVALSVDGADERSRAAINAPVTAVAAAAAGLFTNGSCPSGVADPTRGEAVDAA